MAATDVPNLTGGRLLARNTIINLVSEAAPFLVALFAIPVLVDGLGVDRYGVLTLSMVVVGYFGLFDFGLGRAATKFIADAAASGEHAKVPDLFWTALFVMLIFGIAGGLVVALLAPWLVLRVLKILPQFQAESLHAFYLLALSMPVVISAGSLNGTLAAYQRFDLIDFVRVPAGVLAYVGPLMVLPFSHSIAWMVAVMIAARFAAWAATFALCMRSVPALRHVLRPCSTTIRPLLSFGGWVTVSGIVGPVMVYFDRFLIGAMLSVAAVSYYTVPFQVTGKLAIVPSAMSGVVFAAFSGSFTHDPARAAVIFERAARYTLMALFAPVLLLVALAPEILTLWMGAGFAVHSADVMRTLAIAIFLNGLALIPYGLIQAANRPDLTARFHLAEVGFYVLLVCWIVPRYGIVGAALAWLLRVACDTLLMFVAAWQLMPRAGAAMVRLAKFTVAALLLFGISAMPVALPSKAICLAAILALFVLVCWTRLLQPAEKKLACTYLRIDRLLAYGAAS